MTQPPPHAIVLQGATSYLAEVKRALAQKGIDAEIVKPPGSNANA